MDVMQCVPAVGHDRPQRWGDGQWWGPATPSYPPPVPSYPPPSLPPFGFGIDLPGFSGFAPPPFAPGYGFGFGPPGRGHHRGWHHRRIGCEPRYPGSHGMGMRGVGSALLSVAATVGGWAVGSRVAGPIGGIGGALLGALFTR